MAQSTSEVDSARVTLTSARLLASLLVITFAACALTPAHAPLSAASPASPLIPFAHGPVRSGDGGAQAPWAALTSPLQPASLNHHELTVATYIAGRWQAELDEVQRVVLLARKAAHFYGLDPLLVLAVIARESSFQHNGNAGNLRSDVASEDIDPGRAHGLMQVAGRFHPEKMPVDGRGRMRVTTDEENLFIGARILKEYLERERGNLTRALQRYNGNLTEGDTRFSTYVLRVRSQLAEKTAASS